MFLVDSDYKNGVFFYKYFSEIIVLVTKKE